MKDFMVATDLSERSDRALRRAIALARAHGGRCHLVHIVDEGLPDETARSYRAAAMAQLERIVQAEAGDTELRARVVSGDPLVEIPRMARELEADLVVLGLHRPRAFLDRLRETTMERLVQLMRRPVLLVHDRADHPYRKILVPVSFSPACATALTAARALAPQAEIAAFHAVHLPFSGLTGEGPGGPMDRELTHEAEAARAVWCEGQGLAAELCAVTPVSGSLGETVDAQIARENPDLIALGVHTRSGMAPYALGSFAARLVRNPPTDLLLAHP